MKTLIYCTESHRNLLEDFLIPSLPGDLEPVVHSGEQKCATGTFQSSGWLECMLDRVGAVTAAIEASDGDTILVLDSDIQFFARTVEPLLMRQMEGFDFVAQSDGGPPGSPSCYCGGFFALRCCKATRSLFLRVREIMNLTGVNDQIALNSAIPDSSVRAKPLPSDLFWSPRKMWSPGTPLHLPSRAVAHHANWCVGVEHKRRQLEDGLRCHRARNGLERHGSETGGKWIMKESLVEDSVVYSGGVGEDISFDLSILERYGPTVHAFDPTPRAAIHVSSHASEHDKFVFHPVGLLDRSGEARFHPPANPRFVSYSVAEDGKGEASMPVRSIIEVIRELGHREIALLKLDIEGAEYAVLDCLLARSQAHRPKQILVEFHDWLDTGPGMRTRDSMRLLAKCGYSLLHREGREHSFAAPGI